MFGGWSASSIFLPAFHMALYDCIRAAITRHLENIRTTVEQRAFVYEGNGLLVPARLLTAHETGLTSGGVDFDADKQALQPS